MRRLWAAGAAILMCLAPGGGLALAQEASGSPAATTPTAVHVTGTETIRLPGLVDSQERVGDVIQMRGVHARADERIDDPRLSGVGTIEGNVDVHGREAVQWGTFRIENEGGSWEGTYRGVIYGGTREHGTVWLTGSGDYEGLPCYWSFSGDNTDLVLEIEGLVFPGEAPVPQGVRGLRASMPASRRTGGTRMRRARRPGVPGTRITRRHQDIRVA